MEQRWPYRRLQGRAGFADGEGVAEPGEDTVVVLVGAIAGGAITVRGRTCGCRRSAALVAGMNELAVTAGHMLDGDAVDKAADESEDVEAHQPEGHEASRLGRALPIHAISVATAATMSTCDLHADACASKQVTSTVRRHTLDRRAC